MSLKNILKNWTLFVSMATGTLLYLLFSQIEALSGAATVLEPVVRELLPVVMFLVLFVTFCKVDFRKMRPVGWHGWIGLVQLLLVAGAVGVIAGLRPTGSRLVLMEAALTCVIAPCASAAPVVTGKLGGDLSAMTTYTFISNFATAFLIPLTFPLVDPSIEMSFFQSFCRIFYRVCTVLLGPMLLAYVVKHYFHRVHRVVLSVRDLSFYLWACCLAIVTGTTIRNILHAGTPLRSCCSLPSSVCYSVCCSLPSAVVWAIVWASWWSAVRPWGKRIRLLPSGLPVLISIRSRRWARAAIFCGKTSSIAFSCGVTAANNVYFQKKRHACGKFRKPRTLE